MAPSRPDMVFPGCPTCGEPVASTYLHEAVEVASSDGAGLVTVYANQVDGRQVLGGRPEMDAVTFYPCEHEINGDAAHLFNLAALNLTHPDLVVEVRVTIPAAANYPDRREPRIVAKTGTYSVADLDDQVDADRLIAERIRDGADAVVNMLGLIGVPEDRAELLNTAVFEALGAASACWENLAGAGVFESTRCAQIGRDLLEKLGIPVLNCYQAPTDSADGAEHAVAESAGHERYEVKHAGAETPVRVTLDPYPVMGRHI